MIDPSNVPDVHSEERLARFIFSKSHIRPSDNSIKHAAFLPPPSGELSVTRHRDATDDEVWGIGRAVATVRERSLRGRADVVAARFLEKGLAVLPAPEMGRPNIPDNPNHANVVDWPLEKERQKLLALEIAAQASFVRS